MLPLFLSHTHISFLPLSLSELEERFGLEQSSTWIVNLSLLLRRISSHRRRK